MLPPANYQTISFKACAEQYIADNLDNLGMLANCCGLRAVQLDDDATNVTLVDVERDVAVETMKLSQWFVVDPTGSYKIMDEGMFEALYEEIVRG